MLRFHIVTLFPSFFDSVLTQSLMARALENGIISVDLIDPREFSKNRHRHVDDRPYGGSPGMVMQLDPVCSALRSIASPGRMLAMAPNGISADQSLARSLSLEQDITILCGRYEGFDARLYDIFPLEAVSVGDMVLNGGETAALALVEAASRLVPGFMGKEESGEDESFSHGLLEYPHFTRPPVFEGYCVPEVLLQGNHGEIAAWRRSRSLETTCLRRPGLLDEASLTHADRDVLRACMKPGAAGSITLCLMQQDEPKRWQKTLYDPLSEDDAASLASLGRTLGIRECLTLSSEEELERAAAEEAERTKAEPVVAAIAPWPAKGGTASALQLRKAAAEGRPLILLAGMQGYLAKPVLKRCSCCARPPHSLRSCRLSGRDLVVMLLDRILGEYW